MDKLVEWNRISEDDGRKVSIKKHTRKSFERNCMPGQSLRFIQEARLSETQNSKGQHFVYHPQTFYTISHKMPQHFNNNFQS